MPEPASIEAREYSRWDDDDLDPEAPESDAAVEVDAAGPIELIAGDEASGERIDKWLAGRMSSYSRSRLQRWIADGHVCIEGVAVGARQAIWKGDRVVVAPQASASETAFVAEDVPLAIVFEDEALIVIDKPSGLVVHPGSGNWSGTLLNGLLRHDRALATVPRAGIVHRLDKDTTGLMVVARTLPAQTELVRQLQARTVGRSYLALVAGKPPATGRVALAIGRDPRDRTRMAAFAPDATGRVPTGARPAATRFETLASGATASGFVVSLVECRLETGRTHQIRVHMTAIGHPLVGDATYRGPRGRVAGPWFGRQALHAWRLRLIHPVTRADLHWTAPVPEDFATLAAGLGIDLPGVVASLVARADPAA